MSDKPKENKCCLMFFCSHVVNEPCVYFSGKSKTICGYRCENYECVSKIATANKMTIKLKELMGE